MRKLFLLISFAAVLVAGCAQYNDDGFIEVRHVEGKRHAKLKDKNYFFRGGNPNAITLRFNSGAVLEDPGMNWNIIYGKGLPTMLTINGELTRAFEDIIVWRWNGRIDGWEIAEFSRVNGEMSWNIIDTLTLKSPQGTYSLGFINPAYQVPMAPTLRHGSTHDFFYEARLEYLN